MARCEVCGSELSLPFVCSYCGGTFCSRHRLPEAHNCRMMHLVRMQKPMFSDLPPPPPQTVSRPRVGGLTSRTEVTHLLAAWVVLSICFSTGYFFRMSSVLPLIFAINLCVVGTGFMFHELAHKFTAQRYGYWSEFRLWPWGLAMALLSSLLTSGSFIFAAPGATYVVPLHHDYEWPGAAERRRMGLMSLAGPLSNVAWAVAFFFLSLLDGLPGVVGAIGFQVNLWLAAFNMIPLGGLDGRKILGWSIAAWAAVAVPLWVAQAFLIFF
ncbi:MAG: AN1-type zinc finger domain-containing protein [Thermoproteota archaeon]